MSTIASSNRAMPVMLLSATLMFAHSAVARDVAVVHVVKATTSVHYGWADVLRVSPVYGPARTEQHRQECIDQPVVEHEARQPGSSILGAVIGGVLGSTVGKGDGRTAATVVGAVAGGTVGAAAGRRREYESTTTSCRDVVTVSEQRRLLGYDIEYRYRGEVYASRLTYDPGVRMRVRIDVSPDG